MNKIKKLHRKEKQMCESLLVNHVMEDYDFDILEVKNEIWNIVFPGSSGEEDCFLCKNLLNQEVDYIWHKDSTIDMEKYSCIILPGGSSWII